MLSWRWEGRTDAPEHNLFIAARLFFIGEGNFPI
jgi:hypothetical protein